MKEFAFLMVMAGALVVTASAEPLASVSEEVRPSTRESSSTQQEESKEEVRAFAPASLPVEQRLAASYEVVLYNNVLFNFDKAALTPEGKAEIDKAIAELKKYPKDLMELYGHTCDIGPPEYNMALGQRRADAVRRYMVENGIDAGRIKSSSRGMTAPCLPNTSPQNRKLNRRVEFVGVVVN
ncbi:MAG: OmpA family protein [Candidatus Hydrogenedentes bacterium]|nr:OmpA family protein [Candidatus Hydrogenedentota bacterium]